MNTDFGKWLKTFRINIGERLYQMSKRLELTSSFLSAVETGKKHIPDSLISKLKAEYKFSPDQELSLNEAIKNTKLEEAKQKNQVNLKIQTDNTEIHSLAFSFARHANSLTEDQRKAIEDILGEIDYE